MRILLLLLLLCSCSPLKKLQRSVKTDSVTVDRSIIEQHSETQYRDEGILTQTIIEFYPPSDSVAVELPKLKFTLPIKRIVQTKLETKTEASQVKDSTVRADITTKTTAQTTEKVDEKPPAAVSWIKWVAIALGSTLLIIIIIKFF